MPVIDPIRAVWSLLVSGPLADRVALAASESEALEARLMLTTFVDTESNNTFGTAQQITLDEGDLVTATRDDFTFVDGTLGNGTDVDYFEFTLSSAAGVMFDVDARLEGLSNAYAQLSIYDANETLLNIPRENTGNRWYGKDFFNRDATDTTWKSTYAGEDASWYLDLDAGTYYVSIGALGGWTGDYDLRILADTTYSADPPTWESLPGAADTLYLDFDGAANPSSGGAWSGSWSATAFDLDGDASTFSPEERYTIYHAWRVAAEDFSPYNINVKVGDPGTIGNGVGYHMVITNSAPSAITRDPADDAGVAGIAYLDVYGVFGSEWNAGFVFNSVLYDDIGRGADLAWLPVQIGNVITHEFGHGLGLEHYDAYNNGTGTVIMNYDAARGQALWSTGTNHHNEAQDDMAVIGNARNTFGYRTDDHGGNQGAASALANGSGSGIIEQAGDVDWFSFSGSGDTTVTVNVDEYINNLDAKLTVYDSTGQQLGQSDPGDSYDATVTLIGLAAGTYYAVVESNGDYSENGQYDLHVDTTPVGDSFDDIIGRTETGAWWAVGSDGSSFSVSYMGAWNVAAAFTNTLTGDFNGDGRTDVAGQNSAGYWIVSLSDGTSFSHSFWAKWVVGGWVDFRVGDFNGDGRDDFAARRNGNWWIAKSDGTKFVTDYFGKWTATTDYSDVVVGDFNGDGNDDIAGRNPSNYWLVSISDGETAFTTGFWKQWASGTWEDIRVGDFNGDGRDDLSSFRGGNWWIWESTGTTFVTDFYAQWGTAQEYNDVVAADFNGDGRTDIAGRTSSGDWYVGVSDGDTFTTTRWGRWASGAWDDVTVGDYNGDGRLDIAGNRNGNWWLVVSDGTSFTTSLFGSWSNDRTWSDVTSGRYVG